MSAVTLHFAHANGFPAGSYRQIFNQLPADWKVLAKPQFGHEGHLPVNANWSNQVTELLEYVRQHNNGRPVYAVGHSFGAVISFMAACEQPELFSGLIAIDPPLVTGPGSLLLRGAKYTPYINKITPAKLAQTRNTRWRQDTDLVAYFRNKALFKNMPDACIADYVDAATALRQDQRELTFKAAVEADIFRNIPHNLNQYKGRLQCPGLLITGEQTTVCRPQYWKRFLAMNPMQHIRMAGGHMLPLEYPDQMAAQICQTISQWEQGA